MTTAQEFRRWMHGWHVTDVVEKRWLIAYQMPSVRGETPGEAILFMKQGPSRWHVFKREPQIGSATNPWSALENFDELRGQEAKAYAQMIMGAPRELVTKVRRARPRPVVHLLPLREALS